MHAYVYQTAITLGQRRILAKLLCSRWEHVWQTGVQNSKTGTYCPRGHGRTLVYIYVVIDMWWHRKGFALCVVGMWTKYNGSKTYPCIFRNINNDNESERMVRCLISVNLQECKSISALHVMSKLHSMQQHVLHTGFDRHHTENERRLAIRALFATYAY